MKLQETFSQLAKEINSGLERFLIGKENITEILSGNENFKKLFLGSNDNTQDNRNYELAMSILKDLTESDTDIMFAYFGTADGEMYSYPEDELPEDYDPRVRPWYKKAIENKGKTVLSEPYQDASTGEVVITVAKTVLDGNKVIGRYKPKNISRKSSWHNSWKKLLCVCSR
ncbi:hypothetical protein FQB35_04140 [Crassaminicella thermophila]|uniref:Cache domain-containing protein n=1 Tax=Crassaminicella thermophila TaxID=2599308 RepID=A0A5C0SAL8_CRATE|nr:cache domain-containing protein [Crassaminicella thermophila]QEK11615.1 hypothetical protein FQB35_04140 [Crassaminicella thermophila]